MYMIVFDAVGTRNIKLKQLSRVHNCYSIGRSVNHSSSLENIIVHNMRSPKEIYSNNVLYGK